MTLATMQQPSYASMVFAEELAPNTRIAYRKGWTSFDNWCAASSVDPLSATDEDVSRWLVHLAAVGLHPGTVSLYRSAVNKAFEVRGLSSPVKTPPNLSLIHI